MRAPKPCAHAGCPHDATPGRPRCPDHDLTKTRDQARPTAAQRGYGPRWRRTRARYLAAHPHCECQGCPRCHRAAPTGRCLTNQPEVDHIDGLGPNGPRGHDPTNLRHLCKPCHSHRTGRDQGPFA